MNTERVALQRRLLDDDQWVVPHNIFMVMFSPASVNVLPFDPHRGRRGMFLFCLTLPERGGSHAILQRELSGSVACKVQTKRVATS